MFPLRAVFFCVIFTLTSCAIIPGQKAYQDDSKSVELLSSAYLANDNGCKDWASKTLCDRFLKVHRGCDSRDPIMIERAKKYCRKTCGLCKEDKFPAPTVGPKDCQSSAGGCCGDMKTAAVPGQTCPIELGCPDALEAFNLHNSLRAKHGSPPLQWDHKLYLEAMDWAKYLASRNVMEHSGKEDEGENLAFFWRESKAAVEATKVWYEEIKDYDYYSPDTNFMSLHFSQLVWKSTTKVGIGCAKTWDGETTHVVARYSPRGNWQGEFEDNVLRF